MDYQQAVRATTKRLREDQQSGWSQLREFLDEQGIRPTEVALAVIYPMTCPNLMPSSSNQGRECSR